MTWDYINTRAADNIPALADQLAALLKAERGGKWLRSDAIRVAIDEAIKARTTDPAMAVDAAQEGGAS